MAGVAVGSILRGAANEKCIWTICQRLEEALRSRRPTLLNAIIDETAVTESGRITSLNPTAKKK